MTSPEQPQEYAINDAGEEVAAPPPQPLVEEAPQPADEVVDGPVDPTFTVAPAQHTHFSRSGQVVEDEDQIPDPSDPDPDSPSARHVKELRKREIRRHQAAAPVEEQIRIQLSEAGLA